MCVDIFTVVESPAVGMSVFCYSYVYLFCSTKFFLSQISVTLSINCLRRTKDLENSTAAMGRARLQLDKTHSKYFPVPAVVESSRVTDSA